MNEHTPHLHRCLCGAQWTCGRVDCGYDDACEACEQRRFEAFAEDRGWTVAQARLPELEKV